MFVGRVIPNKKFETIIRAFHVYRTRHNPRARLLLVGSYSGFERYLSMLQQLIASLGTPDVHFLGHVANEELTRALRRRGPLPVRERARRLLRADHRGVLQGRPGAGLCVDGRARDDGRRRRALRHDRPVRDRAAHGGRPRRSSARRGRAAVAGRRARAAAGPGLRRDAAAVRRGGHRAARRGRRRPSRGTSGRSSSSSNASRSCGSSGRRCFRRCPQDQRPGLGRSRRSALANRRSSGAGATGSSGRS